MSGYEDAQKQFKTWDDDDPKWKNYMGLAKKMVTDSNAVAQEKGEIFSYCYLSDPNLPQVCYVAWPLLRTAKLLPRLVER